MSDASAARVVAVDRFSDELRVDRQRVARLGSSRWHSGGGVDEDDLSPLQEAEQAAQAVERPPLPVGIGGQRLDDVVPAHLSKRAMACRGPGVQHVGDVVDTETNGLDAAGPGPRSNRAAVAERVEPLADLGAHRFCKPDSPSLEPRLKGRRTVVVQHSRGGQDFEDGLHRGAREAGEHRELAGSDRRSRCVLDGEKRVDRAADHDAHALVPAVHGAVLEGSVIEYCGERGHGRRRHVVGSPGSMMAGASNRTS